MGRRGCRLIHIPIADMDRDLEALASVRPCFAMLFAECSQFVLDGAIGCWVDGSHVDLERRALLGSAGLAPAFAPRCGVACAEDLSANAMVTVLMGVTEDSRLKDRSSPAQVAGLGPLP